MRALERDERSPRLRAAHAVDRPRRAAVSAESDLERGDASIGRERFGSEHEDANGHRDAYGGEATHEDEFAPWHFGATL